MFEKLKEKLRKIFAEKGIDEGTAEEVLVELDEGEETEPQEVDPAPIPEEPTEEVADQDTPKPEEGEEALPEEEPAPESVPLPEEAPVEEPQEPIVEQSNSDYETLKSELGEYKKTVDAMLARIESLEEALRAGGVIESGNSDYAYGVDKASAPAKNPTDAGLDSLLRRINRKSF